MLTILALDPGINRTGWAVIVHDKTIKGPDKIKSVWSSSFSTKESGDFRLDELSEWMAYLLSIIKGDLAGSLPNIAVMDAAFAMDRGGVEQLYTSREALKRVLRANTIPHYELSPTFIKKAVTNYGNADKAEIVRAVTKLVGAAPGTPDEADAIACGYAWLIGQKAVGVTAPVFAERLKPRNTKKKGGKK